MDLEDTPANAPETEDAPAAPPRARDWLWRPWYAKLWWTAIPLYWLPAGGLVRIDALTDFYDSGYAVVTNMIFLPVTAFLVLGFGWLRHLLTVGEPADWQEDLGFGTRRRPGFPPPTMDEFDPRSGPLWIGNRPLR